MKRVRFVHWNGNEAAPMKQSLISAKFQVEHDPAFSTALMRQWRENPPSAFVIDLSRLPARGREIAIALRQSPKTRHVPIVFCDGAPEKVKSIRDALPDATYCRGAELVKTLKAVKPLENPLKPVDMMNRYGSRTTAQKLGIKRGSTITLVDPPRNVNSVMGDLPGDTKFIEQGGSVTLCFVHSIDGLRVDMSRMARFAAQTKLWCLWRKKTASNHDGVTEPLVRETGINVGLVDYKICSVDSTWSAMAFAPKKV
jgi:CheY-like chemotaxis protein